MCISWTNKRFGNIKMHGANVKKKEKRKNVCVFIYIYIYIYINADPSGRSV